MIAMSASINKSSAVQLFLVRSAHRVEGEKRQKSDLSQDEQVGDVCRESEYGSEDHHPMRRTGFIKKYKLLIQQ